MLVFRQPRFGDSPEIVLHVAEANELNRVLVALRDAVEAAVAAVPSSERSRVRTNAENQMQRLGGGIVEVMNGLLSPQKWLAGAEVFRAELANEVRYISNNTGLVFQLAQLRIDIANSATQFAQGVGTGLKVGAVVVPVVLGVAGLMYLKAFLPKKG